MHPYLSPHPDDLADAVRVAPSGDAEAMAREVIEAIVNALAAALEVSHL